MKKTVGIRLIEAALMAMILALLTPFAYSVLYAVPSTDDFCMIATGNFWQVLKQSFSAANSAWLNHSGNWFYFFLETLLDPLNRIRPDSAQFGVELLGYFMLFQATIIFMMSCVTEKANARIKTCLTLLASFLFILLFLNIQVFSEPFYWFVGSSYMWNATFMMATLGLEVKYFRNQNRKTGIPLCIIGALACNSYSGCELMGLVYLTFLACELLDKRKLTWTKLYPLFALGFGLLVSISAPGNFKRKASSGQELQFFATFVRIVMPWLGSLLKMICNPLFLLFSGGMMAIGYCVKKQNHKPLTRMEHPVTALIVTVLATYIVYYPMTLGYGSTEFHDRIYFIFYTFAVPCFSWLFYAVGSWAATKKELAFQKKDLAILALVLTVGSYCAIFPGERYKDLTVATVFYKKADIKASGEGWRNIYRLLIEAGESGEKNVELCVPYVSTDIIKSPGFDEGWARPAVCNCVGIESFEIYWEEGGKLETW